MKLSSSYLVCFWQRTICVHGSFNPVNHSPFWIPPVHPVVVSALKLLGSLALVASNISVTCHEYVFTDRHHYGLGKSLLNTIVIWHVMLGFRPCSDTPWRGPLSLNHDID